MLAVGYRLHALALALQLGKEVSLLEFDITGPARIAAKGIRVGTGQRWGAGFEEMVGFSQEPGAYVQSCSDGAVRHQDGPGCHCRAGEQNSCWVCVSQLCTCAGRVEVVWGCSLTIAFGAFT